MPDSPPYYVATFQIQAGSEKIEIQRPLQFRFVDPERGELVRPVAIVPAVAVDLPENAFVFPNGKPQQIEVQVKSNIAKAAGEVRLQVENGWKVTPASRPFNLADAGEQADLTFEVTPAASGAGPYAPHATAEVGGQKISAGMRVISYPHIPIEITFPAAEARAEQMNVTTLA